MILSKKSRYGLRALVDLAVNSNQNHMSLGSIAERNGISQQYLEQVFAALRRAGILKSVKGPQGGYFLSRDAGEITVAEIVLALDGAYHVDPEKANPGTEITGITETLQNMVIGPVNEKLDQVFQNVTLLDLENEYRKNNVDPSDMYYI